MGIRSVLCGAAFSLRRCWHLHHGRSDIFSSDTLRDTARIRALQQSSRDRTSWGKALNSQSQDRPRKPLGTIEDYLAQAEVPHPTHAYVRLVFEKPASPPPREYPTTMPSGRHPVGKNLGQGVAVNLAIRAPSRRLTNGHNLLHQTSVFHSRCPKLVRSKRNPKLRDIFLESKGPKSCSVKTRFARNSWGHDQSMQGRSAFSAESAIMGPQTPRAPPTPDLSASSWQTRRPNPDGPGPGPGAVVRSPRLESSVISRSSGSPVCGASPAGTEGRLSPLTAT
jgi:hypothetical protein